MVRNEAHARASPERDRSRRRAGGGDPRAGGDRLGGRGSRRVYLVGGAVRDLLLGRGRDDLDLVVEADPAEIAARLGGEVVSHERFATAKARLGGHEIDIARARRETYERPGALPRGQPGRASPRTWRDATSRSTRWRSRSAATARRRACSTPTGARRPRGRAAAGAPPRQLRRRPDPGAAGRPLRGPLRVRARGARPPSSSRTTDLGTVSAERREAELLRIAAEPTAPQAFALLSEWGLVELRPGGAELAARVVELLDGEPWSGTVRAGARGAHRRPRPAGRGGGPRGDAPRSPLGGRRGGPGARPRRARPRPGARAPSGSTSW